MKKRMLWVCIYTWDEEENALGMYDRIQKDEA